MSHGPRLERGRSRLTADWSFFVSELMSSFVSELMPRKQRARPSVYAFTPRPGQSLCKRPTVRLIKAFSSSHDHIENLRARSEGRELSIMSRREV